MSGKHNSSGPLSVRGKTTTEEAPRGARPILPWKAKSKKRMENAYRVLITAALALVTYEKG